MSLEQKHTKQMRKLVHLDIGQMGGVNLSSPIHFAYGL
jgi:hypothetical protein